MYRSASTLEGAIAKIKKEAERRGLANSEFSGGSAGLSYLLYTVELSRVRRLLEGIQLHCRVRGVGGGYLGLGHSQPPILGFR